MVWSILVCSLVLLSCILVLESLNSVIFPSLRDGDIQVANLVKVCWLEVQGTFSTALLTPGTMYEVAFLVMIKDPAFGWEVPVAVRCTDPEGNVQTHMEHLLDKPKAIWIELIAGTFMATAEGGIVQFSLFENEGWRWKAGLIIKGAVIRPKI